MATAEISLKEKIDQTMADIETHYTNLCDKLQEQKHTFINALISLKNWVIGIQNKLALLNERESVVQRDISLPQEAIQTEIDRIRRETARWENAITARDFTFDWKADIELRTEKVGLLHYRIKEDFVAMMKVNFQRRFKVKSNCRKGCEEGNLIYPEGATVEPLRDQILIANFGNNSVDIFYSDGRYKSRFGVENGIELDGPNGIVTFKNEIYISNLNSNCISVHSFNGGILLRRIGRRGNGDLEFSSPEGLAVFARDDGCLLYIADRENNRVKVFLSFLSFRSDIGKGVLHEPRDVEIFNQEIYVLDGAINCCIKVFNERGFKIRQFLKQGKGEIVWRPRFFKIDFTGNILISDKGNCCITIYNIETGQAERVGERGDESGEFKMPTGITQSLEGRIIIVDGSKDNHVLQILEDTFVYGIWQ